MLEQQIRARLPGATVVYVDRRSAPFEADGIATMLPRFGRVIAAIYSAPQPGQVGTQTSLDAMSAAKETAGTILQRLLDLAGDRVGDGQSIPYFELPKYPELCLCFQFRFRFGNGYGARAFWRDTDPWETAGDLAECGETRRRNGD